MCFLEYSLRQSAYFCLDKDTSRVYTSRHVAFHESIFPFSIKGSLRVDEDDPSDLQHRASPSVKVLPRLSPTLTPAPVPLPSTAESSAEQNPQNSTSSASPTISSPSSSSPSSGPSAEPNS